MYAVIDRSPVVDEVHVETASRLGAPLISHAASDTTKHEAEE